MMRNTFGNILTLTTFGESHGPAIGGVIDGFPAGVHINLDEIQHQLDRRRPGQSSLTTSRREDDKLEVLSGIYHCQTLGTPIGFVIRNSGQRPSDYREGESLYRPSHADYTYQVKYGIRDHRGGGRASARETACRVAAGAFAMQALRQLGMKIVAYASQIGTVKCDLPYQNLDWGEVDSNAVRCPNAGAARLMEQAIEQAKSHRDSIGGTVTGVIQGVPAGLGEPVYGRLNAQLAHAMMSINAAKGFELGLGFGFASQNGSDVLDHFVSRNGKIAVKTNFSGGVQGGISNGEDIYFKVAFKPVATIMRELETVSQDGQPAIYHAQGRHDACVVPRAVPVVESMAALVMLDSYLLNKTVHL